MLKIDNTRLKKITEKKKLKIKYIKKDVKREQF